MTSLLSHLPRRSASTPIRVRSDLRAATRRRLVKAAAALRLARDAGLTIAGLACLSGAAYYAGVMAGLVVTGISFFVLEWRING